MNQPTLFPEPERVDPPERCPDCGAPVRRESFTRAECVSCSFVWTRSGQLHQSEPLPY